jgi:hypothetical protein
MNSAVGALQQHLGGNEFLHTLPPKIQEEDSGTKFPWFLMPPKQERPVTFVAIYNREIQ